MNETNDTKATEKKYRRALLLLSALCLFLLAAVLVLFVKGNYLAMLRQTMNRAEYAYTSNASYPQRKTQFEMLATDDCDIVFAGDSITARFEWQEYFPKQKVLNRGIDSDVAQGLYNRLDSIVGANPKKIFFMIGINDIRQEIPAETTLDYYQKIIDEVRASLPDCQIYIESVLPVSKATGIDNARVEALNSALLKLASDNGLDFIDLYSHLVSEGNDFLYTVDGVHPTGEGYAIWMEQLAPYVEGDNP